MPLLFYGRLEHGGKRRLYSPELRPIESSVFDNYKIRHMAPYHQQADLANWWWFWKRQHTAISWNECRLNLQLSRGIKANETDELMEQTVWIPGLIGHLEALRIARSEFPDFLVPGAISFRFNNQDQAYAYD